MMPQTTGIHHVTAISGGPQRNVDFYAGTLGLRLVKKTVNFDDPETYHLYYGDEAGSPGTIMTFFPWAHAPGGVLGPASSSLPRSPSRPPLWATGRSAWWRRGSASRGPATASAIQSYLSRTRTVCA